MDTALNVTPSPQQMMDMFMLKVETDKDIAQLAEEMPAQCESFGFSLLKAYSFHEILESKGFPITRKAFVYEICKAKVASLMLTAHPEFSLFMPCKISVYENGGKTVISTMNMGMVLESIHSEGDLFDHASAIFKGIQDLMHSIAQQH